MLLKKKLLKNSRICLILDKTVCHQKSLKTILQQAIRGGIDIVQYRDKTSSTKTMIQDALGLLKIAKKQNVPFIINDRLDVACAVGADGIHLGQRDLSILMARKIFGKTKIYGLSCRSISELLKAQKEKVDYLGFGPVFKTLTKPKERRVSLRGLTQVCRISKKPVFIIGGITERRLRRFCAYKNLRIAVCRDICLAGNIKEKVKRLKKMTGYGQ